MRYCRICDMKDIEDEYHFIPVCPKYRALHWKLIPTHYWRRHSMIKFIELMTRDDLNKKIAKYVQEPLTIRDM